MSISRDVACHRVVCTRERMASLMIHFSLWFTFVIEYDVAAYVSNTNRELCIKVKPPKWHLTLRLFLRNPCQWWSGKISSRKWENIIFLHRYHIFHRRFFFSITKAVAAQTRRIIKLSSKHSLLITKWGWLAAKQKHFSVANSCTFKVNWGIRLIFFSLISPKSIVEKRASQIH